MRKAAAMHLRAIKELHSVTPRFFPVLTLYCLFGAITPYVTVFFSARILTELAMLRRAEILWRWVLAGVLCVGLAAIGKALLYRRYNTLLEDLYGRKDMLFVNKMFRLDYSELDKQENHDLREQIKQNENWSGWGLMRVHGIYSGVVTGILGLFSGAALTVSLFTTPVPSSAGWLVVLNNPIFVLVLAAGILIISILAGRISAGAMQCWGDFSEEAPFGNRLFSHFGFIGQDKGRAIDIRMNDQQRLVRAYWSRGSVFGIHGAFAKLARGKMGVYASLGVSITTLTTGMIYLFTCLKALGGAFDVGRCTQYIGAATAMVANVFALTDMIGVLKANTSYLEKTFAFLDIPNTMYQGSLTTEKRSDRRYDVQFKDVSFRYPGSDLWALRHVNMKFKVGRRLAIVGENGSGKTTFIKLLCRLYDPQEGQILLNGIDIRKYRYDDYMRIFSVVFQDFQLICQPLGNNVAGSLVYDRERAKDALIDAGFGERLATLEKGLDTMLYKNLSDDGVEVSGGEAQKIAIARALYKDAPFIILDEPFAAIDAKVRTELRNWLREMVVKLGITSIFVTHDQDEAVEVADEIIITNHGHIEQMGTPMEIYKSPDTPFVAQFIGRSSIVEHYERLLGFDPVEGATHAVIRPEFVRMSRSAPPQHMSAAERGIVKDVIFRGNHLDVVDDVGGIPIVTERSLEKDPVEIGEKVYVLIYRLYIFDENQTYLVENREMQEGEVFYI